MAEEDAPPFVFGQPPGIGSDDPPVEGDDLHSALWDFEWDQETMESELSKLNKLEGEALKTGFKNSADRWTISPNSFFLLLLMASTLYGHSVVRPEMERLGVIIQDDKDFASSGGEKEWNLAIETMSSYTFAIAMISRVCAYNRFARMEPWIFDKEMDTQINLLDEKRLEVQISRECAMKRCLTHHLRMHPDDYQAAVQWSVEDSCRGRERERTDKTKKEGEKAPPPKPYYADMKMSGVPGPA